MYEPNRSCRGGAFEFFRTLNDSVLVPISVYSFVIFVLNACNLSSLSVAVCNFLLEILLFSVAELCIPLSEQSKNVLTKITGINSASDSKDQCFGAIGNDLVV